MTNESQALADLSKPSLAALSHVLRNPETWPRGFRWNYTDCETCAIGLAGRLWRECISQRDDDLALTFGMTENDAWGIFYDVSMRVKKRMEDVTPSDVADAIDAHLARVTEAAP